MNSSYKLINIKKQTIDSLVLHEEVDNDSSLDELEIWSMFKKGKLVEIDKFGHKIYEGQCKLCHKFFENHRSFYSHGKKCYFKTLAHNNHTINEYFSQSKKSLVLPGIIDNNNTFEITIESCLNHAQIALVNAVCRLNLPMSTLGKNEWRKHTHTADFHTFRGFSPPCISVCL